MLVTDLPQCRTYRADSGSCRIITKKPLCLQVCSFEKTIWVGVTENLCCHLYVYLLILRCLKKKTSINPSSVHCGLMKGGINRGCSMGSASNMSCMFSENANFAQIVDWQWEYRCVGAFPIPNPGSRPGCPRKSHICHTRQLSHPPGSFFSNPGSNFSEDCPTIREPRVPNFLFINRFRS